MAQANFVEEQIDRVQTAFDSVQDEFEKFQKQFGKRRKQFEKETQKRVKRLQGELRRNSLVKRAESFQKDATRQIESGVDRVLSTFQIASQSDIKKLDRKLGQISRKLNTLEKVRKANGASV